MTPKPLIIQDSEGEDSSTEGHHHHHGAIPAPPPAESLSGEARKVAIMEAHAALIAETPDPLPPPPPPPPKHTARVQQQQRSSPVAAKGAKAVRSKTGQGRLESSELDVYNFELGDEEDGDFEPLGIKKRKRVEKKGRKGDENSGKREGVVTARRIKSITDIGILDESSGDDWRPGSKLENPSGRKATRSNTVDNELAPLLPKKSRKSKGGANRPNYFDGDLSLGLGDSPVLVMPGKGAEGDSSPVKSTGTKPTATTSSFMIDLTNDDLILPTQTKAEYHALSSNVSASCNGVTPPAFAGFTGSCYATSSLQSTVPDPPSGVPWGLQNTNPPIPVALPAQALPSSGHSLTSAGQESSPPVLNPGPGASPPKGGENLQAVAPVLDVTLAEVPPDIVNKKRAKIRAVTDQGIDSQAFGRVASEWRAAKGKTMERSKTLGDAATVSLPDDDYLDHEQAPEKKKKVVRKKGAAKDKNLGEGKKQSEKGTGKKPKPKSNSVVKDSDDTVPAGGRVTRGLSSGTLESGPEPPVIEPKVPVDPKKAIADSHDEDDEEQVLPKGDDPPQADAQEMPRAATTTHPQPKGRSPKRKTKEKKPRQIVDSAGEDADEADVAATTKSLPPTTVTPAKRATSGATSGRKKKPKKATDEDQEWGRTGDEPNQQTPRKSAQAGNSKPEEKADKDEGLAHPETPDAGNQVATSSPLEPADKKPGQDKPSKKPTDAAARVPFRVGLSRRSRIPSLLKVFRK